jgi:hypothetical protein
MAGRIDRPATWPHCYFFWFAGTLTVVLDVDALPTLSVHVTAIV